MAFIVHDLTLQALEAALSQLKPLRVGGLPREVYLRDGYSRRYDRMTVRRGASTRRRPAGLAGGLQGRPRRPS
jgi:hypothetical protein